MPGHLQIQQQEIETASRSGRGHHPLRPSSTDLGGDSPSNRKVEARLVRMFFSSSAISTVLILQAYSRTTPPAAATGA